VEGLGFGSEELYIETTPDGSEAVVLLVLLAEGSLVVLDEFELDVLQADSPSAYKRVFKEVHQRQRQPLNWAKRRRPCQRTPES
jgi:hypothetical protein